jgi:hypothetical protein
MSGAVLRLLQHGADSERGYHRGDVLGLVTDDGENCSGAQRPARADNMLDQSSPACSVQNLG